MIASVLIGGPAGRGARIWAHSSVSRRPNKICHPKCPSYEQVKSALGSRPRLRHRKGTPLVSVDACSRRKNTAHGKTQISRNLIYVALMPPNVNTETKTTVVSRLDDHTMKNGTKLEPNEPLMEVDFAWVGYLSVPALVVDECSRRVIAWNAKMEALTGVMGDRIIGHPIEYILAEGSIEKFVSAADGVLRSAESARCDLCLSDSARCFTLNMTVHRSSHGKTSPIVCFGEEYKSMDLDPCEPALESPFPMLSIGSHGQITGWNPPLENLTGHRMEDVIGRCFHEFVPNRDHQERLREAMALSLTPPGVKCCLIDFVLRNGEMKRMLVNITGEGNQHTHDLVYYLILSDAADLGEQDASSRLSSAANSAQHDASASMAAQELRDLFDNANTVIFGTDKMGKVNQWNDQTKEITGFTAEEALDADLVKTFIEPHVQPDVQELLENALRGRGTSNFELELRTKYGELRYLLVNTTPRRDARNEIVGMIAIAQDITEACKHDRAVASMANELRKLIDTANAPIFGIDKDG